MKRVTSRSLHKANPFVFLFIFRSLFLVVFPFSLALHTSCSILAVSRDHGNARISGFTLRANIKHDKLLIGMRKREREWEWVKANRWMKNDDKISCHSIGLTLLINLHFIYLFYFLCVCVWFANGRATCHFVDLLSFILDDVFPTGDGRSSSICVCSSQT